MVDCSLCGFNDAALVGAMSRLLETAHHLKCVSVARLQSLVHFSVLSGASCCSEQAPFCTILLVRVSVGFTKIHF